MSDKLKRLWVWWHPYPEENVLTRLAFPFKWHALLHWWGWRDYIFSRCPIMHDWTGWKFSKDHMTWTSQEIDLNDRP